MVRSDRVVCDESGDVDSKIGLWFIIGISISISVVSIIPLFIAIFQFPAVFEKMSNLFTEPTVFVLVEI